MIDKILAIQNCGTSGTLLLQSLFDNHPEILSLPGLHGQTLLIFWEQHGAESKAVILDKFIETNPWFFEKTPFGDALGLTDMGPDHHDIACVDKAAFTENLKKTFNNVETLSRKNFIISVYQAYNETLGKHIDPNGYILYPIHCLPQKYALQLSEDFREVKFLHSLREPVQNMGSLAKHISKNPGWSHLHYLSCVAAQVLSDYTLHVGARHAHGMLPYVKDTPNTIESRAVKLEDIHKNTAEVLKKTCAWLQISWSDTLLESTFDGKLWHNRAESIRQTGIGSQTIAQKHADFISEFDQLRLNYLATPFKQYYHYPLQNKEPNKILRILMPLLLFLPFKMERENRRGIGTYLMCRLKWLLPARKRLFNRKETFVPLL